MSQITFSLDRVLAIIAFFIAVWQAWYGRWDQANFSILMAIYLRICAKEDI